MIESLVLIVPLAWRNLLRNRRRSLITFIVVIIGMYSILFFNSLLNAWAQSTRNATLDLMTGSAQIHARGYLNDPTIAHVMPFPGATLQHILSAPGVTWAARVRVPAIVQSEYKLLPVTLTGVMPAQEMKISTIPHAIVEGQYLANPSDNGIIIGRHLAQRLKTRVGKHVIVMSQSRDGANQEQSYTVEGLFAGNKAAEDDFIFTGLATAQHMLNLGGNISEISFKSSDAQLPPVIATLQKADPSLDVRSWQSLSPFTAATDQFMHGFTLIWSIIMFVLMAIGIVNTQLMTVIERVREFGLLRAIGMKPALILLQVIVESCLLTGAGVIAGAAGCVVTIRQLHNGIDLSFLARGAEFFGAGHVLYLHVIFQQVLVFTLLVWSFGVLVTLWPAVKAAHANAVEAMNHAA